MEEQQALAKTKSTSAPAIKSPADRVATGGQDGRPRKRLAGACAQHKPGIEAEFQKYLK
jgi:hypothetical protein